MPLKRGCTHRKAVQKTDPELEPILDLRLRGAERNNFGSTLPAAHRKTEKETQLAKGGGGGGEAKSYDGEKAWSSSFKTLCHKAKMGQLLNITD
jgi:hypothetical protein